MFNFGVNCLFPQLEYWLEAESQNKLEKSKSIEKQINILLVLVYFKNLLIIIKT